MKVRSHFSSSPASPRLTLRQRFEASWWCERVELSDLKPRGGLLSMCREERVRPIVASLSLLAFLGSQCVLPGAFLLSEVRADEARRTQMTQAQEQAQEAKTPAWAKKLRAEIAGQNAARAQRVAQGASSRSEEGPLRLAQAQARPGARPAGARPGVVTPPLIAVPGSRPGRVEPSRALECEDCEVDVRALDLSKVPTERELRRAGQLGGALNPLRPADPQELKGRLEKLLRRAEIPGGLAAQLPARDPRARGLEAAKKKLARAQALNLDFGQAIQEWNKHNYRPAARMFEKHLKDYPESPWAGEALLHLGCDAKYNGRFDEAQRRYDGLLRQTRSTRNERNRQKKRERRQGGAATLAAEQDAAVTRALQGAESLDQAVARIDAPTEADDESFEIHQKAKARFADLYIAVGRWDEAARTLQDVLATDTDWRRKTWAQSWLTTLSNLAPQARRLAACGPQALQHILASLNKPEAARKAGAVVPKTLAGLSLAELETLSARSGAPMRAFQVSNLTTEIGAQALSHLALPAIVHLGSDRGFDGSKSFLATRQLKRAPMVALHPEMKKAGQLPSAMARLIRADKGGNAVSLFKNGLTASGHYLVLEGYDANTRQARVFDPQENRFYRLSAEELTRQWSGKGLALAGKSQLAGKTALASVPQAEKEKVRGGCCGSFRPVSGTGNAPDNSDGSGGCGDCPCDDSDEGSDEGSPVWKVNRTNLNVFVKDTPLWVKTPKGPDVRITLSYNSQDALSQHNAFGNKWMFSYGSYVVEDTQYGGGQIIVFMPDGSQDTYSPDGQGGFTTSGDNLNRLSKLSNTRYELLFPGGDKAIYDIPAGTSSLQPFLIEQRDRFGYSLTFGYNEEVHLTTITDAGGGVTKLQYNAAGKVARVWDPFGRHASFSYDASNNLIECVDMEGHAFQYTYDTTYDEAQGTDSVYLTRLNTAQGPWTFSHYYGYPDRILTATDPAGQSERWEGNWWGPYFSHTDKRGTTTSAQGTVTDDYEARISSESFADGTSLSKDINTSTGAPQSLTGRDGQTTRLTYNAQNQPTSITDPKGNVSTLSYAANGLDVTGITNANGVTVATYTYNSKHQVTSATGRGGTTTFTYTAWGALASVTDPQDRVMTYTYNAKGQLAATALEGAVLGSFSYDEKGRVKTQTDSTGLSLSYEYNNLNHVTKVGYPDGTSVETDYSCCGLPGVVKDRSGRRSYYDYDVMKRLVRVQDAAGNTLQFDYDAEDNRTRLLDAKGQITRWVYDALGRVTQKKYHDGTLESSTYAQGRLSRSTGARGQIVNYGYDANGNTTLIDYPNMADVSFSYNALNQATQVIDGVGTHTFSYDGYGRLNGLDGPMASGGQNFSYDAMQRLVSQSVERGASGGLQSQSYTFDALERLKTLTSSGTQGAGVFTYNYVGNTGMLSRLDLPNGAKAENQYDSLHRLTQVQNLNGAGANLASYAYGYDTRDVRTGVTSQMGSDPLKQIAYAYDAVDQLTGENATGGAAGTAYSNTFQYDAMGNRTRGENVAGANTGVTSSTPNPLNQLTAFSHSVNGGAPQNSGLSYDGGGNLTQTTGSDGSKTLYSYDDADRLIRIENRNAANAPVSKSEFTYDYASRKVLSKEFSYTAGAWVKSGETRRVFGGLDVIQERNDANEVTAQYTRDGNIGGILARASASGKSYFHYDGGGNVTALSDENGALVGRYSYDAFGNTLEASGARAGENPYRFSTKEYHFASGMVDFGFRFYSPGMGRWLNRDPIQEEGGLNLYGFVSNDPANKVDEYGFVADAFAGAVGGAIVGATTGAVVGMGLNLAGQISRNGLNNIDGHAVVGAAAAGAAAGAWQGAAIGAATTPTGVAAAVAGTVGAAGVAIISGGVAGLLDRSGGGGGAPAPAVVGPNIPPGGRPGASRPGGGGPNRPSGGRPGGSRPGGGGPNRPSGGRPGGSGPRAEGPDRPNWCPPRAS